MLKRLPGSTALKLKTLNGIRQLKMEYLKLYLKLYLEAEYNLCQTESQLGFENCCLLTVTLSLMLASPANMEQCPHTPRANGLKRARKLLKTCMGAAI